MTAMLACANSAKPAGRFAINRYVGARNPSNPINAATCIACLREAGFCRKALQLGRADARLGEHDGYAVLYPIDQLAVGGDKPLGDRLGHFFASDGVETAGADGGIEVVAFGRRERAQRSLADGATEDVD